MKNRNINFSLTVLARTISASVLYDLIEKGKKKTCCKFSIIYHHLRNEDASRQAILEAWDDASPKCLLFTLPYKLYS